MIKENLDEVFKEIKKGNNLGEPITLVGATKMQDANAINQAISYGLTDIGENKAQEFRDKNDLISLKATRHFIGRLQTNKLKYLIGKVYLIQSVDSFELANEISKKSVEKNLTTNILIEINLAGEENKGGIKEQELAELLSRIKNLPNIKVLGLMTVAPAFYSEKQLADLFTQARNIYNDYKKIYPDFKYLSMGMTGDYKIAIANGSNMIRLGTKIFGARNYGDIK